MSQKEAQRYAVVQRLVASEMSQAQAALVLGISVRQVKRLCRRVREQGPAGWSRASAAFRATGGSRPWSASNSSRWCASTTPTSAPSWRASTWREITALSTAPRRSAAG
ncbi:MAG: helix-turn-helix domain-containing protein [Rubrivivax sp.]|nr:helix-turn-helix domain-containing protein [Rubrivivax sp.]